MCTATAQSGFLNSDYQQHSTNTTSKLPTCAAAVRFAMKLPRYNAQLASSTAAGALRGKQEQNEIMKTTPRASKGNVNVSLSNRGNNNMRRAQSARGYRSRAIAPNNTTSATKKSRPHYQDQTSTSLQQHPARPTQELPIPGGVDNHNLLLSRSIDKNDLTKMYDYATWNMYERIVSARRRRLSEMDQQPQSSSSTSDVDSSSGNAAQAVATTRPIAIDTTKQQQPLYKSTSQDESSTAATADETDKSSSTSSSWSRTDSPMTFPGGATFLPILEPLQRAECSSCPPPATVGTEEDHFIFELEM